MLYRGCKELKLKAPDGTSVAEMRQQTIDWLQNLEDNGDSLDKVIVEPKHDGVWCQIDTYNKGPYREARFTSRTEHDLTDQVTDLARHIESLMDKELIPPGHCSFIGELGIGSQHAVANQRVLQHNYVHIYDMILNEDVSLVSEIFAERLYELRKWQRTLPKDSWTWLRPSRIINSNLVKEYTEQHEGLVIKRLDENYSEGTWLKLKHTLAVDYVIMDFNMSTAISKTGIMTPLSQPVPMAATLVCGAHIRKSDQSDVSTSLVPLTRVALGTHEWCTDVAANFYTKYNGKVVTLITNKIFKSGSLRHPRLAKTANGDILLRNDKDAKECIAYVQ